MKGGNFFVLDAEWKHALVRGGKPMNKHSPRLVTMRIPIHGWKHLYLVNAHFPDSSKPKAIRQAHQLLFERAMNEKGHNGVVLVMGDFNASTGMSEGEGDLVCGPHGISHQDAAGRLLKTTAGMPNLSG
jgi:endonuclease/exonuclease/phosphatase family metal-dependent hydrolase